MYRYILWTKIVASDYFTSTLISFFVKVFSIYYSQVLSLQIFWPLTLDSTTPPAPPGAKPNVKFLQIFENGSHRVFLVLSRLNIPCLFSLPFLEESPNSLLPSFQGPLENVVSIHLCYKYLLSAAYWQALGSSRCLNRTEWGKAVSSHRFGCSAPIVITKDYVSHVCSHVKLLDWFWLWLTTIISFRWRELSLIQNSQMLYACNWVFEPKWKISYLSPSSSFPLVQLHCSSPLKSFWYLLTLKSWFHHIRSFSQLRVICMLISILSIFVSKSLIITRSKIAQQQCHLAGPWMLPLPRPSGLFKNRFSANYESPKLYCHLVCISPSCPQEFPERLCQMPWLTMHSGSLTFTVVSCRDLLLTPKEERQWSKLGTDLPSAWIP